MKKASEMLKLAKHGEKGGKEEVKPEYPGESKKCEGLDQFMNRLKKGILVEHEHKDLKPDGMKSKVFYARIALAHLQERDDYYEQLSKMEKEGSMGFLKEALLKIAAVSANPELYRDVIARLPFHGGGPSLAKTLIDSGGGAAAARTAANKGVLEGAINHTAAGNLTAAMRKAQAAELAHRRLYGMAPKGVKKAVPNRFLWERTTSAGKAAT